MAEKSFGSVIPYIVAAATIAMLLTGETAPNRVWGISFLDMVPPLHLIILAFVAAIAALLPTMVAKIAPPPEKAVFSSACFG